MSKRQAARSTNWRQLTLGDLVTDKGGGTPSRSTKRYYTGDIPWVTVKDMKEGVFWIHDAAEHITPEAIDKSATKLIDTGSVIVATRVGLGKVAINTVPVAINQDLRALEPRPGVLPAFLLFCVFKSTFDILKFSTGTTVKGIRREDLLRLPVSLPPLPVQERIVLILQKADEIHRKRQDALGLSEAILPAMYKELFGEARANPNAWPMDRLGNHLIETRYGTSKKTGEYDHGDPVLRIPNVIRRTIDITDLKYLTVSEKERKKLLLSPDDILVVRTNGNKDYVGRCAVFDIDGDYLFASYLIRLKVDPSILNPYYVVAYLSTSMGRQQIDTNSRTSAGQYNISVEGLKAIRIPIPPLALQQKFVHQYEQWKVSKGRLDGGLKEADDVFSCLLARAFSGELTAEWEVANAQEITRASDLHERVPRLIVLAFLLDRARQASSTAVEVPVTALMIYAFLLQMEGTRGRRRLYQFVPHQYGPHATELYADLEALQAEGLIAVEKESEDSEARIALANSAKADQALADLPEDLREDATTVIEGYGDLELDALVKVLREKYPVYAKKTRSRRRPKADQRQQRRSRKG